MMRISSILFTLMLFGSSLFASIKAQNFGNEWIDYTQRYFYFQIANDGWYHLDYNTINNALSQQGIDITTINPDAFQVFGKEQELSIEVVDGGDGTFDSGDYLAFKALKNDGWKDSLLFENPDDMADAYYSFFNDTINYYFTFSNSGNGKRILSETDVNFSAYSNAQYCWERNHVRHVTTSYVYGPLYTNLSSPIYSRGEGWTNGSIKVNTQKYSYVNTQSAYGVTGAPPATIQSSITSATNPNVSGQYNHSFRMDYLTSNTLLADTSFYGYDLIKMNVQVDPSTLTNGNTRVRHRGVNIGQGANERLFLSSVTITYPHTFDFEGKSWMDVGLNNALSGSKQRLSITNFTGTTPRLFVTNEGVKEIPLVNNSGVWEAVVPNNIASDSIELFMVAEDIAQTVDTIMPVNGSAQFQDLTNVNLNDAFIIITHESLMSGAVAYGAYRSSAPGGSRDVLVVDVEELYHQFGAGIEKHPISIKNFIANAFANWSSDPGEMFLIGKGISNKANQTTGSREIVSSFHKNLVPTWGHPGSDNHLTQGVNGSGKSYAIPTGRLAATRVQNVFDYLDKVTVYEQQQDPSSVYDFENKEWQKQVLHFDGCNDTIECAVIQGNFNNYEAMARDTLMGATVKRYKRDPFNASLNSQDFFEIQQKLLDGVSLITFYGHASATNGFAQSIDAPANWNNQDKYPFVIGLGCYTGDIFETDTITYSDQLIKTPNEGAIAFMSTVKLGFLTNLGYYGNQFYDQLTRRNYNGTIGECMKFTVDSIYNVSGSQFWSIPQESNYTAMTLHGDPALSFNNHDNPEIVLSEDRVWTEPSQIDLSVDTFDLKIVLTNLGKGFREDYTLSVERSVAGSIDSIFVVPLTELMYLDTITVRIPALHNELGGLNSFNISVDLPFSQIPEQYDETGNNQLTYDLYINSEGIAPIWPYEYAIIPFDTVTLKASTVDPFKELANYRFEIDTNDSFSTPFLKYQNVASIGGVVEANINNWIDFQTGQVDSLIFTDSTVYFWRVAKDSAVMDWNESSFQYIPERWGWGQSHFHQFKNNSFQGIEYDKPIEDFTLTPNVTSVGVTSYINFTTTAEWAGTSWTLGGARQDYAGWTTPSINIAVIDPCTLEPWKTPWYDPVDSTWLNPDHCFGQLNAEPSYCGYGTNMGRNREHVFFIFRLNVQRELDSLASMLANKIPDGHYVLAYTYIPDFYSAPTSIYNAMPAELITEFQNLGATNINYAEPDNGFVFFCKKGVPSSVSEIHSGPLSGGGDDPVEILSFNQLIQGCNLGKIRSVKAGPARSWNALYWKHSPLETPSEDSTRIKVYASNYDENQVLLIDTVMTWQDSVLDLHNIITADFYPFITLEAELYDTLNYTASQIDRWQLLYDPVPELAINPKKGLYMNNFQSIQEGDSGVFAIAIENVSEFDTDSLVVDYYHVGSSGNAVDIPYPKQDSLKAHEILLDTVSFATMNAQGDNFLWVVANPYETATEQYQREQFFFNNLAQQKFTVNTDDVNPLLDVTFDGVHIIDEDLVSAKPEILISLDDENEVLLLNQAEDTAYFEVELKRPNSNSFEKVRFKNSLGEDIMEWIPAENSDNKSQVLFNPTFTEDGIYVLRVQARDKTNNFSGEFDYEISFEVITQSSITHIYNYPNPFSTSTSFVFTLTGSEIPDAMMIQIMNVTGKVVREITLDELGPLRVGNNRTEFAWDGRDQFGDVLANGVYLYRVEATINGESIDHRSTFQDATAFKKGFGKMYLMR